MERTDAASATIAATPEVVFTALTDPDARAQWLPPEGMTGHFEWFDASPGGGYRLVLAYDDPAAAGKSAENRDVVDVRFVDVEPPNRIVEECDFESDDPQFAGTMTMTWTIEAAEGASMVTITAMDVPPGINPADHAAGMQSSLENLVRRLS
ncbi:ATPase [Nocardioides sp. JQ2195]|uniref:SRPBCC domain-containing protein n=1 Tax=Nocardioides sp. JQ2195 TaxID=2592334 RepID=UPI00143E4071|nr:SRPBCC domain-containing protein [Nocardioides sp. JQ2195]QIX27226.1 ATPase [Nocardioides sp. JQ2195]